jgi:Domain of unknown function DUF29
MTVRKVIALTELYETDFVLWTEKTAELLRQKNYDAVDWENVIEEIECMGRNDRHAVESLLVQLIKHLLKLAYRESERERNARHWVTEIDEFRSQLEKKLESTTLANHVRDYFEKAYSDAKKSLIRTRVFAKDSLPLEPPFSLEQVLDGDWFPVDIDRYISVMGINVADNREVRS